MNGDSCVCMDAGQRRPTLEFQMTETRLDVKGMTCGSCVRHINVALDDIDGIEQIEVSLREGRVLVKHQPGLDTATLVSAIEGAGYDARIAP